MTEPGNDERPPLVFTAEEDVLRQHYLRYWGQARDVMLLEGDASRPEVGRLLIIQFQPGPDVTIYATLGMSHSPMDGASADHRVELFLPVTRPAESIYYHLTALALYPFEHRTLFASGQTVRGDESIIEGSVLTSVLLHSPDYLPPGFRIVEGTGYHVEPLWVIPISETERRYKTENGLAALKRIWLEKAVELGDLSRPPAV